MIFGIDKRRLGFVRFYGVILLIIGLIFYLGYVTASWQGQQQSNNLQILQQNVKTLTEENQQLLSQINSNKIALDVANLANQQHQKTLMEAKQQISQLKEQLGFYQRVMAPELTQDGFVVERLEVSPTPVNNTFSLSMVLLQHENIKASVSGELEIWVHGALNGNSQQYDFSTLMSGGDEPLKFGFKYFQVISRSFTIPENFIVERFEIRASVYKYKRKQGDYNTSITWNEALSTEESTTE
uniref:DUF6776 family protein n=1 Tax=Ningiella ruwaisensis TaxID=2364274 RepID=UPI0010A0154B|nr:DUF6776 family protein [Ningiella ruwaisensis]